MNRVILRDSSAEAPSRSLQEPRDSLSFESFTHGTRYAAIGDSLTHQEIYLTYLETFYLTLFPDRNVEMLNLGISGDTVGSALSRFSWDIQPLRPSVASVLFVIFHDQIVRGG